LAAVRDVERQARVLVVDDEPALRRALERLLSARGMEVFIAADGQEAVELMEQIEVDVVLVDLVMPRMDGLQFLEFVKSHQSSVEVILMTAYGDVETAARAVWSGAYHFLTKPFRTEDEVVVMVSKAAERRRLLTRAAMLERRLEQMERFGELIGNSPRMREVYRLALGVASASSTVLILGESGTGKELTARAIHEHSPRSSNLFVAVNCSAIPVNLVESELFGHVRGAFTGATATREGMFETANGGTLFLDEVGDLPPLAQVKLLRALQQGEIKRVGSNETRHIDVRVIAATNVDLRKRISEGLFREDLFYRLNVVAIELPPLRERKQDIALLAYHFLQKYAARSSRDITRFTRAAIDLLENHDWPGNVRELENAIEYSVVFCRGDTIRPEDLPIARPDAGKAAKSVAPLAVSSDTDWSEMSYREAKNAAMLAFERQYFEAILARAQGNHSEAARLAGLDRSNFRRALKKSRGEA